MLNSFEISNIQNEEYKTNVKLNDDLYFNCSREDLINEVSLGDKKLICYGYCFDVRKPESNTADTLKHLINRSENFLTDIRFLNGHYILLFNFEGEWKMITDAVGMTPVYIDRENKKVLVEDFEGSLNINGFNILSLEDYTTERLSVKTSLLSNENLERKILNLVSEQYKYFEDESLTINFRRNNMNKALIAILSPVLKNQTLNLRENDNLTQKVGSWISRDFKMNVIDENTEPTALYMANVHLMNFNSFLDKDLESTEEEINEFESEFGLEDTSSNKTKVEYNLLHNLNYRNERKPYLMYDPFNVVEIQSFIYNYIKDSKFNPLNRIIKLLHPSIDFYDFAKGETLAQKYNKVKKKNKQLINEMKKYKVNEEFLRLANQAGIDVSDNLDGQVREDGVTFYPANQSISKDDIFEVTYNKKGQGMILVESYFNNPKNAHRIKVNLNGEITNIDEFINGKFINAESEIHIVMNYERDYDAASWQKAGKLTIREI